MNLEKVIFGFFIVLALTLNIAFVMSHVASPEFHTVWLLFIAIVVNLIATILKLGDRSQVGALLLATALVADLQLLSASAIWAFSDNAAESLATVVALASAAIAANVISVTLLVVDSLMSGR